jgi:hypothetical protein
VTKANENEALLWKIAVLRKKSPVGARTFCPSPILVFYIPSCWKCLPAWRKAKYQNGRGTKCPLSNVHAIILDSSMPEMSEEGLIFYILCSIIQGNFGLGIYARITLLRM